MQHTDEMVSKSFASPTLASKFFTVLARSSISLFTSKKNTLHYHRNVHSDSQKQTDKRREKKTGRRLIRDLNKTFHITKAAKELKILNKSEGERKKIEK